MPGEIILSVLSSEIPSHLLERLRAGEVIMDGLVDDQGDYMPVVVEAHINADGNDAFTVYKRPAGQYTWSYEGERFQIHKLAKHVSGQDLRGEVVACVDILSREDGLYVVGTPCNNQHQNLVGRAYPTIDAVVHAFNCN